MFPALLFAHAHNFGASMAVQYADLQRIALRRMWYVAQFTVRKPKISVPVVIFYFANIKKLSLKNKFSIGILLEILGGGYFVDLQ